jgi:2-hydroxychromene-2-carboxylate isomerase
MDRGCWEQNANVADESILTDLLNAAGYDGTRIVKLANLPEIKDKLRANTAEAKEIGLCGVPSYRIFQESFDGSWLSVGGIVWGQDEINIVEDLIAGWDDERSPLKAEPRNATYADANKVARL